jgi:hypothetical protein
MATGTMPDGSLIGGGAIGTNVVFGDSAGFNRKRSLELLDEEWSPSVSLQGPDVREVKRVKGLK